MQGSCHHAAAIDQVADAFNGHGSAGAQSDVALDRRLQHHGARHGAVEIGLGQALSLARVGGQAVEQGPAAQIRKGRQPAVAQFLGVLARQPRSGA